MKQQFDKQTAKNPESAKETSVIATRAIPAAIGSNDAYTALVKCLEKNRTDTATRNSGSVAFTACAKDTAVFPREKLVVRNPTVQHIAMGKTCRIWSQNKGEKTVAGHLAGS